MKPHHLLPLLLAIIMLLGSGCARDAKLIRSWADPHQKDYRAGNILVMAVSRDKNSINLWENIFVEDLTRLGIHATASHKVLGHLPEPDRKAVETAILKTGATSVLITRVADRTSKTTTYQGTVHYEPRGFYRGMYGYYGSVYQAVYMPPMDVTTTKVRLESNLYDAATAALVWTAQSEAVNPKLLRSDYGRLIGLLIEDMRKNGVLK